MWEEEQQFADWVEDWLDELEKKMNRIRYVKTERPNIFSSGKVYKTADGKEVRVFINDITKAYGILDLSNDQILLSGVTGHMHKTKIAAKKALETLGVDFEKESRKDVAEIVEE